MTPLLTAQEQKSAAEASSSGTYPEGIYVCRVLEPERWTTGKSLVWKFRVAKGEKYAGKEFWTWSGLEPESIWKTKEILTALGFDLSAEPREIAGTPCKVHVTVETRKDTGEPTNRVKKVFPYDGPELPSEYEAEEDPFNGPASSDEALI